MDIRKATFINGIVLLLALLVAAGLKYQYSQACSDHLTWILGPTAGLVERLSGIDFEKEVHTGYVNHTHRVIIAPACAGVNFLIIAFCMAVFCGIFLIESKGLKLLWVFTSLASAYLLTLLVNALRIILSIYFYEIDFYSAWITPARVHRLEGTLIYFFFLCLFYRIIKKGLYHYRCRAALRQKDRPAGLEHRFKTLQRAYTGLIPLFWYGLITLGVPLLNGALRENRARFAEHSGMVIAGCFVVLATVFLFQIGWQRLSKRPGRINPSGVDKSTWGG